MIRAVAGLQDELLANYATVNVSNGLDDHRAVDGSPKIVKHVHISLDGIKSYTGKQQTKSAAVEQIIQGIREVSADGDGAPYPNSRPWKSLTEIVTSA